MFGHLIEKIVRRKRKEEKRKETACNDKREEDIHVGV